MGLPKRSTSILQKTNPIAVASKSNILMYFIFIYKTACPSQPVGMLIRGRGKLAVLINTAYFTTSMSLMRRCLDALERLRICWKSESNLEILLLYGALGFREAQSWG